MSNTTTTDPCEVCIDAGVACPACARDAALGRAVRGPLAVRLNTCELCGEPVESVLLQDGAVVGATYACGHWGVA